MDPIRRGCSGLWVTHEQLAGWGYNFSEVEQIVIDTVAEKAAIKAAEANAATVKQG
ncbi:hypothetical protein [Cryobacterium sp. TMT1-21]|uniref:hypothetical protein n=1 Tax=Cryobacterium sp. TMT1-21 TaxID=1259234 RepID=UPI00141AFFED|nr:hypothetical protein [Cryobacterium sp. TMT1-21]